MKPYLDRDKLVIPTKPKGGDSGETRIFLDRRIGITWPGSNNFGYYCVFGMEDRFTVQHGMIKPLVLLAEGTDIKTGGRHTRQRFFEKLIAMASRYEARWLFADMRKRNDVVLWSFDRVVNKRRFKLQMTDTSEWDDFENMRPAVDEVGDAGLLDVPRNSIISREKAKLTPSAVKQKEGLTLEERFPAIMAMSRVVTSWEMYPWVKPKKDKPRAPIKEGYR